MQNTALKFPLGTPGVNLLGAFILSLITYLAEGNLDLPASSRMFLAVWLLRAFTTMSTFSLESFRLLETGQRTLFMLYFLGTNTLCLIGIYAGKYLAAILG
ncbi:MAG: CrcB family protein [Candidatus Bathyarchaeota archaeon]|nr:CrcB family protein [Candidatus Bathyarchaeota archaeon]